MKTCFSLLVLLTAALSVFSQSTKTNTVAQIESYSKSIDQMTKRRKEPDLVIADVSDYDTEKPEWRKFKSTKELDAFRKKTETYTVAYNWRTNSKIVSSVFTVFSPSGDWAQYVTHYFRPDGSAAKVNTEMRTCASHVSPSANAEPGVIPTPASRISISLNAIASLNCSGIFAQR